MRLLLCRSRSPFAALLRFAMWSKYSHSALYDPASGCVWDSTFSHGGVRKWRWSDWQKRYSLIEQRDSGINDIEGARAWLDAQVGKPYDWTALVGFLFRQRDWQRPDWWFCCEMTEATRSIFGQARFRADASRITVRDQEIAI